MNNLKNADLATRLVFAHAEWIWAYAVDDITQSTKKELTKRTTNITDDTLLNELYPVGFGKAGMYHKNNKYDEIKFVLQLINFLKKKIDNQEISHVDELNNWIEKACLYKKYEIVFDGFDFPDSFINEIPENRLAMCNILTHLAFPDKYERIASDNHKWQIFNSFSGLLSEEDKEKPNIDEKIKLIRDRLGELTYHEFDFYEEEYTQVWNYNLNDEGYSEIQGLQYKKAIILYGAPGTSKTHSAIRLAKALITNAYLSKKENIVKYFEEEEDYINGRIHHLQLHPNYNYEDFVAGVQLRNHSTEPVRGKLFDICDAAANDKGESPHEDMPHVLILDEINRIDLSRLFGEVFSALENREIPIQVCVGDLKLSIPRNLYVIGTMNEIDFSLERIDFALRRRFLWFHKGFDPNTLETIIWEKDETLGTKLKENEVERFIKNAVALNNRISEISELGIQYQIGHTFFAEIVNIYKTFKELNDYSKLQNQLFRSKGAALILWEISIEPILIAFLGNMDSDSRKEYLNELKEIYYK